MKARVRLLFALNYNNALSSCVASIGTAAVRSCGDKSHSKKCLYFYELFLHLLCVVFFAGAERETKSVLYSGPVTSS